MDIIEIRKLLDAKKLIVGTDRTTKELIKGRLSKILISSNSPKEVIETLKKHAKMTETEIEMLDINNDELGVACRKPFQISILGIIKANE